ncbi:helix-turn-helix domain-containing protein [Amycolatopsis rhabdoformis]|uniref:Helix-turn-helix domain-containing protein n=1 Tax=Amycolatopsis rhabdoformis TaxID=1448059 RepID=A0ABZ1I076_9PSEU|nr:helix-turn-helix domain-containing protein [Amycolatopsis rhabdoformis]WSE27198.1 helix-turn-helix domain-containing protein [Amycolatopsis rhabdoformis]
MALGTGYHDQNCPVSRSLEVVGERWTLLIICSLFYGLRRYTDIRNSVGISPAVLTQRLTRLVEEDVVARVPGIGAHDEYELTAKGEELWPVISGLSQWGNEHYVQPDARQILTHHQCGTVLDETGLCTHCKIVPTARDVVRQPRPIDADATGATPRTPRPHRLLEPLRP